MKILITVPILSPGSGLTRYVFSLCKILHDDNDILVIETHGKSHNDYAISELRKVDADIRLISTAASGKINNYIKNIVITLRFRPDIIISNYNALTQYILPVCKGHAKVLHILHNDTDDFYRIGAINGKKVDAWIAPTSGIAERFNKYTDNKYQERVKVISHGVDDAPHIDLQRKSKKLEIVFAGVLYEHKGVKILPKIIEQLLARDIDFHFTVIGGGKLKDWLKAELGYAINKGYVSMPGVIPHDDVYAYFRQSDIFLYPTHIDAFGLVIAEAMINGAVPVVTHISGVTDNLIVNGECGFLIPQDNVDDFVNRVIQLYQDSSLLSAISKRAIDRAKSLFSMEVMQNKYMALLESLTDEE